jgi:dihydroorotate dehydrogenase (NAD+) catalytic subunit
MDPVAVDTRADLGGIDLSTPVMTASGTFGYGVEFAPFLDLRGIGAFVAKSLTLEPRVGNPPPRIAETPSGMLNAISLENVGVEAFVSDKLPAIPDGVTVIASCFGTEIEEYGELCKRLSGVPRVAGIEINASCPHVVSGPRVARVIAPSSAASRVSTIQSTAWPGCNVTVGGARPEPSSPVLPCTSSAVVSARTSGRVQPAKTLRSGRPAPPGAEHWPR